MKRSREFLTDMLRYAQAAVDIVGDYDATALQADLTSYLAVQRALEIIGEAANNVGLDVRADLSDVPFRQAISMRNRIVHGYGTVDPEVVVDTVRNHLPNLIARLESALANVLADEL